MLVKAVVICILIWFIAIIGYKGIFKRYCMLAFMSGVFFFPFYFLGIDVMASFLIMCFMVGIILFIRFRRLRRLALAGIWKLPLLYLIIVKIYFMIWPGFVGQWNASTLWGVLFFGLPLGEIAWAFGFGFYWPLFMGYVFKLKVTLR